MNLFKKYLQINDNNLFEKQNPKTMIKNRLESILLIIGKSYLRSSSYFQKLNYDNTMTTEMHKKIRNCYSE